MRVCFHHRMNPARISEWPCSRPLPELVRRLYGGDVKTRSTDPAGIRRITLAQSPW